MLRQLQRHIKLIAQIWTALFRLRTFSISVAAMFMAGIGFLTAVIFLPRWFQTVAGASATESGYNILPLLAGLIVSAVASGQIVSRTGRYKWLMFGSLTLLAVSLFLLTNLRVDTDRATLWFWMALAGLGIGPSFAVFTLIVQNAVPFNMLGVATSNLTFFRQIGGTVALAIVGTMFASSFQSELVPQLTGSGASPQSLALMGQAAASGALDFGKLTGTGDLGQALQAAIPALPAADIPKLVAGIHQAFSLGISGTFIIGVGAAIIAALAAAAMQELALRRTTGAQDASTASAPDGRRPALPAAD